MTKEEAIRKLTQLKNKYLDEYVDYDNTASAYDMAIEALGREQQLLDAGYQNATVDFYIGGRLFRAKEIAQ